MTKNKAGDAELLYAACRKTNGPSRRTALWGLIAILDDDLAIRLALTLPDDHLVPRLVLFDHGCSVAVVVAALAHRHTGPNRPYANADPCFFRARGYCKTD